MFHVGACGGVLLLGASPGYEEIKADGRLLGYDDAKLNQ
jgi:hypothetical protein